MTRTTNARLAGFTFLFYIVAGVAGAVMFGAATGGQGTAAKLATLAAHEPHARLAFVLTLLTIFAALTLAAALYALTRDEDPDLALLALTCRVAEGVINAVAAVALLALLSVAAGAAASSGPEAAAERVVIGLLLKVQGWSTTVGATAFAVGSALYSYLFLRARSIPARLAVLGVLASILLVVTLPLTGLGLIKGAAAGLAWLPMLAFEVTLGLWLLIKGVSAPGLDETTG